MDPQLLVRELVQQNKLLKETISHFPMKLTAGKEEECDSPCLSTCGGREDSSSETDWAPSPKSPVSSTTSDHSAAIEVLLDLLDRQESRLDLLEQLGKSVLLESSNNSIPIFRGLISSSSSSSSSPSSLASSTACSSSLSRTPTPPAPTAEMDVKQWTKLVLNHLNCLKSLDASSASNSQEVIRFIYTKLDREPLALLTSLLHRNRILVIKQFPDEVPPKFRSFNRLRNQPAIIPDHELLFLFPFKLYLLRYPNAFLNLLNSKFSNLHQNK